MKNQRNVARGKIVGLAIYATVAVCLIIALANFAASPAKADQSDFGPADTGKTVDLKPGTVITIELPENPSTGYGWVFAIDSSVATVVQDEYVPPANQIPGAGGIRLLKLNVIGSGELHMQYERPWESQPVDSFSLIFSVI